MVVGGKVSGGLFQVVRLLHFDPGGGYLISTAYWHFMLFLNLLADLGALHLSVPLMPPEGILGKYFFFILSGKHMLWVLIRSFVRKNCLIQSYDYVKATDDTVSAFSVQYFQL